MNGEDLKFLARRAESVRGRADQRLDEVHAGIRSARRRRVAGAVGATTAAVLAAVVGIAALTGPTALNKNDGPPPANSGTQTPTPTPTPSTTRPLVYSDITGIPHSLLGDPIHVGDRVVETGSGWLHMDVTDDGVVYATGGYVDDGRIWFTDGGTPEQIGSHACVQLHGWPGTVATGHSGSLAAWFDCTRKQHAELVVYDTSSGREVVRREIPGCTDTAFGKDLGHEVRVGACLPNPIVGDHIYIHGNESYGPSDVAVEGHPLDFDVATDRVSRVKRVVPYGGDVVARSYLDDVRSQPRGLVIGDSWETGTPEPGGNFVPVGTRLVPSGDDGALTSAFDTATRRPIHLHLPAGYQPDHDEPGLVIFEWLDDDTVALVRPTDGMAPDLPYGDTRLDRDILACRLSTGRCEVAAPSHGHVRVLPGAALW